MYDEKNKFHIGEIIVGFEATNDVWFDEGELVYVLSELYDPEDSDIILCYVIMQPVSKDVLALDADFVRVLSRGNVSRFLF